MSMVQNAITTTPLVFKVVSLYVVVASLAWLTNVYPQTPTPTPVAYTIIETKQPIATVNGHPAQLTIARLGISLAVLDGSYDPANNSWTLTEDATHFATMTALPNNKHGNTFIYGHNTAAVLEPVKDLVQGDLLTLRTTNGHIFNYVYKSDVTVTPDQTDILTSKATKPQLTLMTCQGIFSETRRIMRFEFVGIS